MPAASDNPGTVHRYGTAGFRYHSSIIEQIAPLIGEFIATEAGHFDELAGKHIGVMITASHNPINDNGVKIIGPDGTSIGHEFEKQVEAFVNGTAPKRASTAASRSVNLIIGTDTRPSSEPLKRLIVKAFKGKVIDHGMTTTPQLHYMTKAVNEGQRGAMDYVEYYKKVFVDLVMPAMPLSTQIVVDCANGVGFGTLLKIVGNDSNITFVNNDQPLFLNSECGADYIKTKKAPPRGVTAGSKPGAIYASLDGDADRLVMFDFAQDQLRMFDGDRIAALLTLWVKKLMAEAGPVVKDLTVGVVQTAYANGASTAFIEKHVSNKVVFTPTGVKYSHHAALAFDIGIYFEANGHGTVLLSKRASKAFPKLARITNPLVGDAIADLFMVIRAMHDLEMSADQWHQLYTERPNHLLAVPVKDRGMYKTTPDERALLEPAGIQGQIDGLIASYPQARAFIRPSGTENVVRIYAEGATDGNAKELAERIKQLLPE